MGVSLWSGEHNRKYSSKLIEMATGSDDLDFNGADYKGTDFNEALPTAKNREQSTPINTEPSTEPDHSTTHPHDIPQYTYTGTISEHQLCGMPVPHMQMFQDQSELIAHLGIHMGSIQDSEADISPQELVVSRNSTLILSIKEAIQERIDEIQELKIKIDGLEESLHEAELREEQCREVIAKKDEDIKSLKQHYQEILAKKDSELQQAHDEAARLKQDNKELQKKLEEEVKRIKKEYDEKLEDLKTEKEIECLKLQLQHKDETHKLELEIKELKCLLAEKNAEVLEKKAIISELEKKQLEQQLKEERESKQPLEQQLEQQKRLIASLQERLLRTNISNPQVEVPTTIASNETIRITPGPTGAEALQPITDKPAKLTQTVNVPPRLQLDLAERIVKNGSSFDKTPRLN